MSMNISVMTGGAPTGWGGFQAPPPTPNLQNQNLKETDFVGTMVSKVLRDLPFSQYQPLKSADD
jgi:hypothetical protein